MNNDKRFYVVLKSNEKISRKQCFEIIYDIVEMYLKKTDNKVIFGENYIGKITSSRKFVFEDLDYGMKFNVELISGEKKSNLEILISEHTFGAKSSPSIN